MGFNKERFPHGLRILVKVGSVRYWMYKWYGIVPEDDHSSGSVLGKKGVPNVDPIPSRALAPKDNHHYQQDHGDMSMSIMESASYPFEQNSDNEGNLKREVDGSAVGYSNEDEDLRTAAEGKANTQFKTSFSEEELFNWTEARIALDMIGRLCSMAIFIAVLIALYAQLPRR
jgi:hypothetical protein